MLIRYKERPLRTFSNDLEIPTAMHALHLSRSFGLLILAGIFASGAYAADTSSDIAVATVGHKAITYGQLQATIQPKLDEHQKLHENELKRLELSYQRARETFIEGEVSKLLDEQALDLEAASRKTTPEALTSAIKSVPVTDAEVQSFYDSQREEISRPFASIEPKIRQYLQNQADERSHRQYLDSLRAKYNAFVIMEPRREQVDAAGPERGPSNAPVTIVEFADFQCPYCGRLAPVLKQLLTTYPTQVRLIYRYYPLATIHPHAQQAAEAAVCASNQSKFWQMHDTLFAEQSSLDLAALKDKAARLGLDAKQFDDCLSSGAGAGVIAADVAAGENLGIEATPATFVNGRFVDGAVSLEQMTALVNDELRRAGLKPYPQAAAIDVMSR